MIFLDTNVKFKLEDDRAGGGGWTDKDRSFLLECSNRLGVNWVGRSPSVGLVGKHDSRIPI
jgi:hypothetical protein